MEEETLNLSAGAGRRVRFFHPGCSAEVVTAQAPGGLLSDFLQLVCTAGHTLTTTDKDTLVRALKAADYSAEHKAFVALCNTLACQLLEEDPSREAVACQREQNKHRIGGHDDVSEHEGCQEQCSKPAKVLPRSTKPLVEALGALDGHVEECDLFIYEYMAAERLQILNQSWGHLRRSAWAQ